MKPAEQLITAALEAIEHGDRAAAARLARAAVPLTIGDPRTATETAAEWLEGDQPAKLAAAVARVSLRTALG